MKPDPEDSERARALGHYGALRAQAKAAQKPMPLGTGAHLQPMLRSAEEGLDVLLKNGNVTWLAVLRSHFYRVATAENDVEAYLELTSMAAAMKVCLDDLEARP